MGEAKRRRMEAARKEANVSALPHWLTLPQRVFDEATSGLGEQSYFDFIQSVREQQDKLPCYPGHEWESWCYVPRGVTAAWMLERLGRTLFKKLPGSIEKDLASRIPLVTAVSAWQMTKGVYVFDPDAIETVINAGAPDDVPHELLLRLPEWCPYVATPGALLAPGLRLHGFFAWVDDRSWGSATRCPPALNFELIIDPLACDDTEVGLLAMQDLGWIRDYAKVTNSRLLSADEVAEFAVGWGRKREYLHMHRVVSLARGSVRDTIHADYPGLRVAVAQGGGPIDDFAVEQMATIQARVVSLLLYLVAELDGAASPERQRVLDSERRGDRPRPAEQINGWAVGSEIGEQIRAALGLHATADAPLGPSH